MGNQGGEAVSRKKRWQKCLRWYLRGMSAGIAFCLIWYAVNRLTSPLRAIKLRESDVPVKSMRGSVDGLRIGCYNIAHGRGIADSNWQWGKKDIMLARLREIGGMLKDERLDIVVLNEVDLDALWSHNINQAELIAREAGFVFWVEQRNIDASLPFVSLRFGNAILSRYPIRDARLLDFPGHSWAETILAGKKRGLLCTVGLSDTQSVNVWAVHLEHRNEETRLASAQVSEIVRKKLAAPLIAAGDFNSTLPGFPRATPYRDGNTAMGWLLETGAYRTRPDAPPKTGEFTFSTMAPSSVIDWILVPSDWRIVSKEVVGGSTSDHRSVIMEVEINPSEPTLK